MVKCSTCCFSIFLCGCNQLKSFHLTMANIQCFVKKQPVCKKDFLKFFHLFFYQKFK